MSTNNSPEISASTLWETGKAFVRGSIIFYTAAKRKSTLAKQLELEPDIVTLGRDFKESFSTSVLKSWRQPRSALYQLLTQKAASVIFYARHRLFECGNKPGWLLARLAQGKSGSYAIPSLRDKKGEQHFETKIISKIIKEFYQELYSSECQNASVLRNSFLDRINLSTLSVESSEDLCRPITPQAVLETIKSLQSGKAPGPDGFAP